MYEEPTCADNLYYGEVNVNGSATESKTRLTHLDLPLIQSGSMAIIPIRSFLQPINITFAILTIPTISSGGIEGSEGSSMLSGWPGTYKCYQTVVTTDGVTNGNSYV